MSTTLHTRRRFLGTAAVASAAPFLLPSGLRAQETAPSKVITMGFIGMGKQSGGLLGNFLHQETRVLAVCDVDTNRRNAAKQKVDEHYKNTDCAAVNNWEEIVSRKDIDAVCIATPDHWHAIPTLAAIAAGKDVYCEKPLTHTIDEARRVIAAVAKHGRILQTGSMQRSSKEFRVACELVRNGVIGRVLKVECNFGVPPRKCDLPEETLEPGLDWNRWVGPAAMRPYNSVLAPRGVHNHFPKWRDYGEFGGGYTCDWGAHHLDIAQWGLGMDESGPVEVIPAADANATKGCTLVYAGGIPVIHGGDIGVRFYGETGQVAVDRGQFMLKLGDKVFSQFLRKEDPGNDGSVSVAYTKAEREFLGDKAKVKLYDSKSHIGDFLGAVKSRVKPITHEVVGGRSAICCHLMNVAYAHHVKFAWDPAKNEFGAGGDPAWATKAYREGFALPA